MIPRARLTPVVRPAYVACSAGSSVEVSSIAYRRPADPGSMTVVVPAIGSTAALGAPVMTMLASGVIVAGVIASTAAVPAPVLTPQQALTLTPSPIASTSSVGNPLVGLAGGAQTIVATVLPSTAAVAAPALAIAPSLPLAPSPLVSTTSSPAPSVVLSLALSVSPSAIAAATVIPSPTVALAAPPVTYLPTGLGTSYAAVYSLHKLVAGYTGPLATVCATSAPDAPTSTIDVYAGSDGTPDLSAASAAFGSSFDLWKLYDQTGANGPATAAFSANRMTIAGTTWGGWRSYHGGKPGGVAADAFNSLALPTSLSLSTANAAWLGVLAGPNQGNERLSTICLGNDDGGGTMRLLYASDRGFKGRAVNANPNQPDGYLGIDQNPCVVGLRMNGSSWRMSRNEQVTVFNTSDAAATMLGGSLGGLSDTTYVKGAATSLARLADVIFAGNPSDADFAAAQAALKTRFAIPTRTSQVIFGGSSIDVGLGQTTGATIPGVNYEQALAGQMTRDPLMLTMGHGGWRWGDLANEWGGDFFPAMYQAAFARNVFYLGGDTNGIQNGVANSQILADRDTLLTKAQGAGFTVVIGTVLKRASFTDAQEQQRQSLNAQLKADAAAKGYVVVDFGDTVYDTVDGTHPSVAGYQAMAAVIKPVLNAVLA